MKTPHVAVFITVISVSRFFGNSIHEIIDDLQETFHWNTHWNVFWPRDLDLWPMTLTYKLDLDILPLDLHAEIQVRMSVRLVVRVVTHTQTDRHIHRQCQNYYTRHVTDVGCKKCNLTLKRAHLPVTWLIDFISELQLEIAIMLQSNFIVGRYHKTPKQLSLKFWSSDKVLVKWHQTDRL